MKLTFTCTSVGSSADTTKKRINTLFSERKGAVTLLACIMLFSTSLLMPLYQVAAASDGTQIWNLTNAYNQVATVTVQPSANGETFSETSDSAGWWCLDLNGSHAFRIPVQGAIAYNSSGDVWAFVVTGSGNGFTGNARAVGKANGNYPAATTVHGNLTLDLLAGPLGPTSSTIPWTGVLVSQTAGSPSYAWILIIFFIALLVALAAYLARRKPKRGDNWGYPPPPPPPPPKGRATRAGQVIVVLILIGSIIGALYISGVLNGIFVSTPGWLTPTPTPPNPLVGTWETVSPVKFTIATDFVSGTLQDEGSEDRTMTWTITATSDPNTVTVEVEYDFSNRQFIPNSGYIPDISGDWFTGTVNGTQLTLSKNEDNSTGGPYTTYVGSVGEFTFTDHQMEGTWHYHWVLMVGGESSGEQNVYTATNGLQLVKK